MLTEYVPVLILFGLAMAFVVVVLLLSDLVGRKRHNLEKSSTYECGIDAIGDARVRISIHYYLVAVLFILFDVEALFLILWATTAKGFSAAGNGGLVFMEIAMFVGVLALTLGYVWRKGGLEWDR
ncbi:MAG: NADH-quinone oxidoreductase subunit A [Planctomycetota bacterium]|jgi:NADH-quinone oxidoreductase subunit A